MSQAADASQPKPLPVKKPAKDAGPEFLVSSAPHLSDGVTTQRIMFEVIAAMIPLFLVAVYMYRFEAIVLTVVTVAGCLAAEGIGNWMRGMSQASLADGSAIVTGVILAFSLPPSINPYMAFLGGAIAIALAKAVFGGLGQNLFNPAMVGRAFLMICFPAAMVTWTPTAPMKADLAAAGQDVDAITTATPLYQAAKYAEFVEKAAAEPDKAERNTRPQPTRFERKCPRSGSYSSATWVGVSAKQAPWPRSSAGCSWSFGESRIGGNRWACWSACWSLL